MTNEKKVTLTLNEMAMLRAFVDEGRNCNGATTPERLIEDNMTWQDAGYLGQALPEWSKHKIAGTMSALEEKGMIYNTGEPMNEERKQLAWVATHEGIRMGWYDDE